MFWELLGQLLRSCHGLNPSLLQSDAKQSPTNVPQVVLHMVTPFLWDDFFFGCLFFFFKGTLLVATVQNNTEVFKMKSLTIVLPR